MNTHDAIAATESRPQSASETRRFELGSNKLDDWLLVYLGPVAWWLKTNWVFALATFIAVVGAPLLLYWVPKDDAGDHQPWVLPWVVILVVLGAFSVLGDKLADRYESRLSEQRTAELEANNVRLYDSAEQSTLQGLNEVNWLLDNALLVPFLKRVAKDTRVETVRDSVVKAAAQAIGPMSRATYYELVWDEGEGRRLVNPRHAVTVGRTDRPDKEWVESKNPSHQMWTILNRPDLEPPIVRNPDDASGLEWNRVEYECFVTIPVRAKGVVFGVLSVNSGHAASIGETQKALIITIARILALVEAAQLGADEVVREQERQAELRKNAMSAVIPRVTSRRRRKQ